jgi:hypothetical protein
MVSAAAGQAWQGYDEPRLAKASARAVAAACRRPPPLTKAARLGLLLQLLAPPCELLVLLIKTKLHNVGRGELAATSVGQKVLVVRHAAPLLLCDSTRSSLIRRQASRYV